jgi:hypothetical protein
MIVAFLQSLFWGMALLMAIAALVDSAQGRPDRPQALKKQDDLPAPASLKVGAFHAGRMFGQLLRSLKGGA